MTTRMLIDARHQEETRVAVVKGNKIEEFDFESSEHKQLKGNIYLAKVTRVEPSLQAAFVDYGGNRHGFLAFSEIHPDYYQIPKEDRDRLLAEEAEHAAEEAALRAQEEEEEDAPADMVRSEATEELDTALVEVEKDESVDTIDVTEGELPSEDSSDDPDDDSDDDSDEAEDDGDTAESEGGSSKNNRSKGRRGGKGNGGGGRGGRGGRNVAKASDQARQKRMALRKRYKIQDVIQRRQVVLVQVVKEERGNKGAALTTYLSLAGRYCVLMPNTSHGGGISRKINSASDRKRLKSIIADLALPNTMGCIVRTAGLSRTKPEIKRDFDYLARLWDEVRENTLGAVAPKLIHSDSDLIKRAIRDIYNRDIEEVLVEGPDGYAAAKDFMKLLMPSHSRRVKSYSDPVSLFQRYGAEDQLSAMYSPEVQLKSGGYLVINPTEALVSIDINSGRSTREHGIEATAVKTNLEAANEIARQLRLRDMAGLVVIDFIDMDRHGNVRKVERAMRDALKNDRARIQVGRISSFGLMEMSRQRLRTGVLEASTKVCPHCEGTGLVRTASSSALSALRLIEEEAAKGKASEIILTASQEATIYVLNSKRHEIQDIEKRYGVSVEIVPDGETEGARMEVKGSGSPPQNVPKFEPIIDDDDDDDFENDEIVEAAERNEDDRPKKRRRRRGRRGGRGADRDDTVSDTSDSDNSGQHGENQSASENSDENAKPKRRSRGGRNRKPRADANVDTNVSTVEAESADSAAPAEKPKRQSRSRKKDVEVASDTPASEEGGKAQVEEKPKRRRAPRKAKAAEAAPAETGDRPAEEATAKPKRASRAKAKKVEASADESAGTEDLAAKAKTPAKSRAKAASKTATAKKSGVAEKSERAPTDGNPRQGWWQRTFG
ncbi:Rne/Rng family ribonuclease [Parasphingorhabdus halotolerans]|uniref:Ribonuclease E n=1 Tax=Parasphingorhabdus halotolerans TaxID=2725558 RepID=A0A6H2DIZ5_9SPHN|nr:Rne/Rng family ribonuclease [Parasphingorhabdus halotolerans]QJB68649.1 Rne/Rng family ribonuclease [Parasphingorhabdus halotolerans]